MIKTLILNANTTNTKQLSGPEKLLGLSRNRPEAAVVPIVELYVVVYPVDNGIGSDTLSFLPLDRADSSGECRAI